MITLTQTAKDHFASLLTKESTEQPLNVRIAVKRVSANDHKAEIDLSYCAAGEQQAGDIAIDCERFVLYVDRNSVEELTAAEIDYISRGELESKLAIKAPNLNMHDNSLFHRIASVIADEINPQLASHGGHITLLDVTDGVVLLQFGGGCQGCGMANVTLKQGVEKVLLEQFPEIVAVKDSTDHEQGENPYY